MSQCQQIIDVYRVSSQETQKGLETQVIQEDFVPMFRMKRFSLFIRVNYQKEPMVCSSVEAIRIVVFALVFLVHAVERKRN